MNQGPSQKQVARRTQECLLKVWAETGETNKGCLRLATEVSHWAEVLPDLGDHSCLGGGLGGLKEPSKRKAAAGLHIKFQAVLIFGLQYRESRVKLSTRTVTRAVCCSRM